MCIFVSKWPGVGREKQHTGKSWKTFWTSLFTNDWSFTPVHCRGNIYLPENNQVFLFEHEFKNTVLETEALQVCLFPLNCRCTFQILPFSTVLLRKIYGVLYSAIYTLNKCVFVVAFILETNWMYFIFLAL